MNKLTILLALCLLLVQCKNKSMETETASEATFYVGTYTNEQSKGIYKFTLNDTGSMLHKGLVAETTSPSFLSISADKKYLIAVNEISRDNNTGTVESYKILADSDSLAFLSRSSSGGAHPCYVTINDNGVVLVSNYTGGNVGLLHLQSSGELTELLDVEQHEGSGTTDRQEAPHAHSVRFEPETENILTVDLGTNELWFSKLNAEKNKLEQREPYKLAMAEGAGPRHLSFHPNGEWIYVLNELNATVSQVIKSKNGDYVVGSTISTLPADYAEFNLCADIHVTSDGKFLYASNRGHHSIVVYSIDSETGALALVQHQSTMGEWPRNFSLSPDEKFVLVANQFSNNIVCFSRNKQTGMLSFVQEIEAFSPVCITFE